MKVLEAVAGGVFSIIGLIAAVRSVRGIEPAPSAGERVAMALHETARAGFWLSLGGLFFAYAAIRDWSQVQWFVLVPILMAGLRLLTATYLSRR